MNFMEAVEQMKQGKKVRREGEKSYTFIVKECTNIAIMGISGWFDRKINISDVEATDWEVVDDNKDWNLADQSYNITIVTDYEEYEFDYEVVNKNNVIKCRDLIVKDIETIHGLDDSVREIINKRFGELK